MKRKPYLCQHYTWPEMAEVVKKQPVVVLRAMQHDLSPNGELTIWFAELMLLAKGSRWRPFSLGQDRHSVWQDCAADPGRLVLT